MDGPNLTNGPNVLNKVNLHFERSHEETAIHHLIHLEHSQWLKTSPQIYHTLKKGKRKNIILIKLIKINGKLLSKWTGRFLKVSSNGNIYICVMYNQDSNAILTEMLKSRSEREIVRTQTKCHNYLKPILCSMFQVLDN